MVTILQTPGASKGFFANSRMMPMSEASATPSKEPSLGGARGNAKAVDF
jgi:hypothetical protein